MGTKEKISVIIPMYNSEKTIIRCLHSVFSQTGDHSYQIIVVNDGSTDNSLRVVEKYIAEYGIKNIELINKKNGGVSSARNAGLQAAIGEWIALLDSDDEWLPNKIQRQMEVLKNYPNIDFLGCNLVNSQVKVFGKTKKTLCKVNLWELLVTVHPQTSTAIFKSALLDNVGLYDTSMRYAEDGNFWIRLCSNNEFYFMPDQLVIYDGGKNAFGEHGLAGNLKEMQRGNVFNLKYAYSQKMINFVLYFFLRLYYEIKYVRRIIIVKIRKWK